MSELQDEAESRARGLQARITEQDAELEQLRIRLDGSTTEARTLREELEHAEFERNQATASLERIGSRMEELERERQERDRAHEEAKLNADVRILELEHEAELARQSEREARGELAEVSAARNDLAVRTERLAQEVEDVRFEAAAHDRSLREEIGTLEESVAAITRESEERVARLEGEAAELRLESGVRQADANKLQAELRQEIVDLKSAIDAAGGERESLEAELAEARAASELISEQNHELEAMRRSLFADQENLEEQLADANEKLISLPAMPGRTTSKPPAVRQGSLRAAALVGFGLILGFIASYPFETPLVSADPTFIPTGPREVEPTAAAPAAVAEASDVAPPAPAEPASTPVPDQPSPREAVDRWAAAWSDQRVSDYLGAYASTFAVPDGLEREAWELLRTERLQRPKSIELTLDAFEVLASGPESATVTFTQLYEAGAYQDRVAKTLELVWEDGDWRIAREEAVDIEL